jgi:Tfp pilus assembly protein PilZ
MGQQSQGAGSPGGSSSRKDKRAAARAKRRLMVRYGVHALEKTAFTRDISESGVFIKTNSVFRPGSTLQVQIDFPDESFTLWGRVIWAKRVPAQLAHILDCGMGVCFIDPPADWLDFCKAWKSEIGVER